MSTNTFSFTSSHPNLFGTLLYKEWRQVRCGVLCTIAGLLAFQLILILLATTLRPPAAISRNEMDYSFLFFIANGAAPILAMLIANLSIAQERQSGTWTWSSTLPATPWQSFAAKLLVWFIVSIISVVLLTLIAAIVSGFEFSDYKSLSGSQFLEKSALGLALGFELYFAICISVFFVEPLIGLCIAAAVAGVTQLSFFGLAGYFGRLFSRVDPDQISSSIITLFVLHGLLIVILGLISFRVYRWGWGAGHFWTWSRTLARRSAVIGDDHAWTAAGLRKQSRFMAMIWLEWAGGVKAWAILLAIVGVLALATDYAAIAYDKDPEFILWFSPLFFTLFVSGGISIFGKDCWKDRGLFLADRGITNHAFSAKMVSALFFISFFIVAVWLHFVLESTRTGYFERGSYDALVFLIFTIGLYQLAMIAGATFRNPVIAFLIATTSYYFVWSLVFFASINAINYASATGLALRQPYSPSLIEKLLAIFGVAATFVLANYQIRQLELRGRVSKWPYLVAMSMVFLGLLLATLNFKYWVLLFS
jgi:ABC-type transport system involved in multi-copper enzyme maturation permease subunit